MAVMFPVLFRIAVDQYIQSVSFSAIVKIFFYITVSALKGSCGYKISYLANLSLTFSNSPGINCSF